MVRIPCVSQPQSPRAPGRQLFQGRELEPRVDITRGVRALAGERVGTTHSVLTRAQRPTATNDVH